MFLAAVRGSLKIKFDAYWRVMLKQRHKNAWLIISDRE